MRILHIVKNKHDTLSFSMAKGQALDNDVSILLLHDAVLVDRSQLNGLKVFACKDDVLARGIGMQSGHLSGAWVVVNYPEIVNLIFDNEKVISW
ncbi:MAG: DsrH/TusB family sulfur metabolism protein [Candidatus Brocadiales bacterium]